MGFDLGSMFKDPEFKTSALPVAGAAAASVFPWASAGASLAYPLLQGLFPKAFGGKQEFKGVNPAKFKDDIVVSDADLSGIRSNLGNRVSRASSKTISDIKQTGAVGRLPAAATQEKIADVGTNISEGLSAAEPGLQNMKRQSIMQYIQMLNQYKAGQAGIGNINTVNQASGNQRSLSVLAGLFDKYRAGSFDKMPIPQTETNFG